MDIKSVTVIYKLCYLSLLLLYNIYETLEKIYIIFKCKLLELYHELSPVNKLKFFPKFEKIPSHLTVLLGNENPSYNDLANLILWCLAAQISFVSFYDYKGTLHKNQDKLHEKIQQKKKSGDHVIWHGNRDCVYKNGFVGQKIHVKVLTEDDGQEGVVKTTKQLALNKDINLTINNFHNELKKHYEFPDPDLGLCCGKTFCLFGYPPWQIRITEFFSIKTHHNIKFHTFIKILDKYNKCEQRYGK